MIIEHSKVELLLPTKEKNYAVMGGMELSFRWSWQVHVLGSFVGVVVPVKAGERTVQSEINSDTPCDSTRKVTDHLTMTNKRRFSNMLLHITNIS